MPRPKGAKDKEPRNLNREQAKVWNNLVLFPYSGKYYLGYQQEDVPFYVKLKMLGHPQIKAGLRLAEAILCNTKWYHEGEGGEKLEIVEYADWVLEKRWHDMIASSLMARCFGFSAFEKVYAMESREGKGDYLTYEKIKYVNPSTVDLYVDENGNYAGFGQKVYDVGRIPPEKTFWFVHQPQQGILRHHPLFGWSELDKDMYEVWYRNVIIWQMFVRYLAKKVSPPLIGYAPAMDRSKKDRVTGLTVWYNLMEELFNVAQKMNEGSVGVLPYEESEKSGEKKIDLKYLESTSKVEAFLQSLNATEAQLFYGLIVPPSIFTKLTSSAAGSYAMMESMVDIFLIMLKGTVNESFKNQVQEQITKDIVRRQFGEKAPIPHLHTTLETASVRKAINDTLTVAENLGKWCPDVDSYLKIMGLPKSAMFDPNFIKPSGRIGGPDDPSRRGEEVGRVGKGTEPRKVARKTA